MLSALRLGVARCFNLMGVDIQRSQGGAFAVQRSLVRAAQPVIFDVGAHTGRVTLIYRRLFPHAIIHAFEPFEESYTQLAGRVARHAGVFLHRLALADSVGEVDFNVNVSPGTNSMLPTDAAGGTAWGDDVKSVARVRVPCTTLDRFCADNHIGTVDILKLDVQGAEMRVLEGALGMLERHAIGLVYMEILLAPAYEGQASLHEYLSFLDAFGYLLVDFFNPRRRYNRLVQVDGLFAVKTPASAPTAC